MRMAARRSDVATSAVLTCVGLAEATLGLTVPVAPWYVVLTVPVVTLPVAARSRRPMPALLVMLAALVLQGGLGSDIGGGFSEPLAMILTLYSCGSRLSVRMSGISLVLALGAMTAVVTLSEAPRVANYVYVVTLVLAAWLAGRGVRLATERSGLLAERRTMQERSRIARELHDVVAHGLSAIVVQAAAERRDLSEDSPSARVLADIEQHGRVTLSELRRLLGLLRVDETDSANPPLAPQPGLRDLQSLVHGSGVHASLVMEGDPVEVGDGLQLAIYRVVQEGLTNVRKHGASPTARVAIRWRDDTVEVEVLNGPTGGAAGGGGGVAPPVPGTGYGLRAMHERVAAYGGRVVTAGPTPDGFLLHVALPVGGTA